MKRFIYIPVLALLAVMLMAFAPKGGAHQQSTQAFKPGEYLKYRVHYGFVDAGEGEITVNRNVNYRGRDCYNFEVKGRSTGAFRWMLKIEDTWGAYVDQNTLKPLRAYRNIREGNYRLKENVEFYYDKNIAHLTDDRKNNKKIKVPSNVLELVSGFYYLRTLNFDNLRKGELVTLKAFFEGEMYDFQIRYKGPDNLKTKWGKIKAHMFVPIMPDNDLFDGEDSIKLWFSDDGNQVPLKVRAEMFVGAVELDLDDYRNLAHPVQFD